MKTNLRSVANYSRLAVIAAAAIGGVCALGYFLARPMLQKSALCPVHSGTADAASNDPSFFANLGKVYTPRAACMYYESPVIWLHFFSDLVIAVAYYSIPLALVYFVRKRKDIAFHWVFLMFAGFILACGTTHLFGMWDLWQPFYKIDGLVRLATAALSIVTAVTLWPLIPKALALPSPAQLEKQIQARTTELAESNTMLRAEIEAREQVEQERLASLERERQARTSAEHANKMKDEFLATLSHELRTPLNAILGWSQLIQRERVLETELQEGLATIERNARVQTQLIEDLLDMNRIISGKVRLDVQRVDLQAAVEAAIAAIKPAAEAKRIQLVKVLDPRADVSMGDPNRLQQVFWNLLSNAVKFTPRGGKVQVTLERVNSHVQVSVTDTGEGVHADFLPFVFDRFCQQDSSITRRHGGLGLGLSIVKHLAELHGGKVRVKSPGEGQGSTFVVELPLVVVHPEVDGIDRCHPLATIGKSPETTKNVRLKGVKVLAVDDEEDARSLIKRILELHDASVSTAGSAAEALELLKTQTYDLIISDIGMPETDGYEFIEAVRTKGIGPSAQVPAVALTAFARMEDRTRALLSGYQGHIAKPVEAGELVAVVGSLAKRSR